MFLKSNLQSNTKRKANEFLSEVVTQTFKIAPIHCNAGCGRRTHSQSEPWLAGCPADPKRWL